MKRAEIIVRGKVQKVGYRDWVEDIAQDTDITGYVENLKPYMVRVVCEGEKENLEKFIGLIKIEDYPVFVKDMDIEYKEPTREFEYFEIKRGDWREELGERMDVAARVMYATMKNTSQSLKIGEKMLGKQDKSLANQGKMLGKQDKTINTQGQTTGSIEGLRVDMGERFDVLDDKYGAINRNLVQVIEKIEHLLEKSDRDREVNSKTMERLLNELIDARKNGTS